ncbi:MAG: tyrosine-type recombinase/integrase [Spirochaetota bacterium]
MQLNAIQNIQNARVRKVVESLTVQPTLQNLSDGQLEAIAKSVVVDGLKDQLKHEVIKTKVDKEIEKLKTRWLNKFQSTHTKRSFKRNIEVFFVWLGNTSITEVDAQVADDYAAYLRTSASRSKGSAKISDNTALQRIAACSSFFKNLVRWRVVPNNPFNGVSRPKKLVERKTSEQIPTAKELDAIEKIALTSMTAKVKDHKTNTQRMNSAGRMAYAALVILRSTGLRVGALRGLTIDLNGYYKAKSKGSIASGRLSRDALKVFAKLQLDARKPFEDYSAAAFSIWLARKSGGKFQAHAVRHHFSVQHYKRHKDIFMLSKALGHASTVPTQAYLASLWLSHWS